MNYPNRPPNINHIDQLLLEYLCETQRKQTESLGLLQVSNARIEQKLDSLAPLKAKVDALETDSTRAKTAIQLAWVAMGVVASAVATVAGWFLAK